MTINSSRYHGRISSLFDIKDITQRCKNAKKILSEILSPDNQKKIQQENVDIDVVTALLVGTIVDESASHNDPIKTENKAYNVALLPWCSDSKHLVGIIDPPACVKYVGGVMQSIASKLTTDKKDSSRASFIRKTVRHLENLIWKRKQNCGFSPETDHKIDSEKETLKNMFNQFKISDSEDRYIDFYQGLLEISNSTFQTSDHTFNFYDTPIKKPKPTNYSSNKDNEVSERKLGWSINESLKDVCAGSEIEIEQRIFDVKQLRKLDNGIYEIEFKDEEKKLIINTQKESIQFGSEKISHPDKSIKFRTPKQRFERLIGIMSKVKNCLNLKPEEYVLAAATRQLTVEKEKFELRKNTPNRDEASVSLSRVGTIETILKGLNPGASAPIAKLVSGSQAKIVKLISDCAKISNDDVTDASIRNFDIKYIEFNKILESVKDKLREKFENFLLKTPDFKLENENWSDPRSDFDLRNKIGKLREIFTLFKRELELQFAEKNHNNTSNHEAEINLKERKLKLWDC